MTPLRGLFRRLKGDAASPPSQTEDPASKPPRSRRRDTANAANPATGGGPILTDEPAESEKKRRRGRRGGRNRRRSNGDATTAEANSNGASDREPRPENRDARPAGRRTRTGERSSNRDESRRPKDTEQDGTEKPSGSRDKYRWGRRVDSSEADQRSRQANRRRRDVRSRNLDAPLPEDIAFRPGEAGGDSDLLPNRRRKPVGFHDTARTLVGGARTIGTWVKRDERHGQDEPPGSEPTPPRVDRGEEAADRNVERAARELAETADQPRSSGPGPDAATSREDDRDRDGADDEDRPKRRRGRRGGRGRGRPSPEADGVSAVEPSAEEATDRYDDTDEPPGHESVEDEAEIAEPDRGATAERERERSPRRGRRALQPVPEGELPAAFAKLGIQRRNLEQLARFGFAEPTPIQERAIPALLNGLDVVGIAQTGSGKTIAFGVPMVEKLDPDLPEVQGIVLVPTRELAQQVLEVLADVGRPWGLDAVGLLGGRSLKADFKALDDRPHIVVGTPGRILDHLRRQTLSLRHVRYAVLDEADQMLDIGFLPDIRRILSRTPQRRQTALFSATMPGSIRRLIWQFMTDPETVRVDPEATPVETIEQIYFEVAQRDKVKAMRELIKRELKGRSLVFCNMKRSVDHLVRDLDRDGLSVQALHGDLDQRQRDRVVQEFRDGKIDALIATNVAARGLDIPEITHVVNFDVPQNLEEYVHRVGRTGRAGREGKAITFVSEWDMDSFDAIQQGLNVEIRREELDLYRPNDGRDSTAAEAASIPEVSVASEIAEPSDPASPPSN